jgi:hypothetical protein
MAGSQERQRDHKRSRPGGQRPLALSRTTEAPERSDQQPVPALQDDRRKRNGDRRQGVTLEVGGRRQGGRGCLDDPLPSVARQSTEHLDCMPGMRSPYTRAAGAFSQHVRVSLTA